MEQKSMEATVHTLPAVTDGSPEEWEQGTRGDAENSPAIIPQESGERVDKAEEWTDPLSPDKASDGFLRVKFNKQERALTLEEAVPFVEMGLKWESFKQHHERLKELAAEKGQSVGEWIAAQLEQEKQQRYEAILEQCGGNEETAQRLFALESAERQRQAGRLDALEEQAQTAQQQRVEERLAEEFTLLMEQVPQQFQRFEDVPDGAVELAVREQIPLLDAFLRHEFFEQLKRQQAMESQSLAAARSAGRLSGAMQPPSPETDSFQAAFYSALR